MENVKSKLRKERSPPLNKACHEIHGFQKLYGELQDKIVLSGQSKSTLTNYGREAGPDQFFISASLPQNISEKEMNKYLASVARQSKNPLLK